MQVKHKLDTQKTLPSWPFFSADEIHAVNEVLQSGKVNYWTGEQCHLFEQEYATSIGTRYAVALMNGTVGLEAALKAIHIGPGDEVITTCRTFIASASSVVLQGAKPVFADVDLESQNITVESIEAVLTAKTKAIIVVHLAGWPCDMPAINRLAKQHHLYVIEDCAQAHGACYDNRPVGSWGDIGVFSFCQDKIMTTGGEGGMLTTQDENIYKKAWSFKDHGKSYDAVHHQSHPIGFRWLHEDFGSNWRMTEVQAAIGRLQLKKLPAWVRIRQQNAYRLNQALSNFPALRLTIPPETISHAYYKYYAFVRPELLKPNWNRDRIMKMIQDRGVPCFVGSCSEIYKELAFVKNNLSPLKTLANAKLLGETSLMFVVHPTLTQQDMEYMCEIIADVMDEASIKDIS